MNDLSNEAMVIEICSVCVCVCACVCVCVLFRERFILCFKCTQLLDFDYLKHL